MKRQKVKERDRLKSRKRERERGKRNFLEFFKFTFPFKYLSWCVSFHTILKPNFHLSLSFFDYLK